MAVDYDLVIVGSSSAGIEAAIAAASHRARVVLVNQGMDFGFSVDHSGWREVGRRLHQAKRTQERGIAVCADQEPQSVADRWHQASRWHQATATALAEVRSPAVLSALGIEVILGQGEFYRKPSLGFQINGRSLRSRAYLLATGCCPRVPEIQGLAETGYRTALTGLTAASLPQVWVIVGGNAAAIELAQTLNEFGFQVTLIVSAAHVLPEADPEAACLVQAQLEAAGVRVLTQVRVTQCKQIGAKKWVQVGNLAIEADEIFLSVGDQPCLDGLNLAAAAVQCQPQRWRLNDKLQTTHPQIYACFGLVGRDYLPHWATAQARIAVNNILFLSQQRVSERTVPRLTQTTPELASVGLTQAQALQRYGKDVMIVQQSLKALPSAQIQGETTGFCKLITRRNGQILGAHVVGAQAGESVSTIALAMQQNLKISTLAQQVFPTATFAAIIHQTAVAWQQLRRSQNPRLQDFWESWLQLRRKF